MTLEDVDAVLSTLGACPPARVTLARIAHSLGVAAPPRPREARIDPPPMTFEQMKAMAERLNAAANLVG